jgi:hypothetical protein
MNEKFLALSLLFFLISSGALISHVVAAESVPWGIERVGGVIVWDKCPGRLDC